jgi:hypothetical protein
LPFGRTWPAVQDLLQREDIPEPNYLLSTSPGKRRVT